MRVVLPSGRQGESLSDDSCLQCCPSSMAWMAFAHGTDSRTCSFAFSLRRIDQDSTDRLAASALSRHRKSEMHWDNYPVEENLARIGQYPSIPVSALVSCGTLKATE